jgi:CRISPR-associated protein Csx17
LFAAAADSPELRLALALAGAHGTRRTDGAAAENRLVWHRANPVRRHFLPLEHPGERPPTSWRPRRFAAAGEKLAADPSVVCTTGDFERDAISLVQRRIVEAHHSLRDFLPLAPVPGTEASLADLHDFLSGRLNTAEILPLARPLMALEWARFEKQKTALRKQLRFPVASQEQAAADALGVYGLLRLCHHWGPVPVPSNESHRQRSDGDAGLYVDHEVRLAPSIYMRLAHGDLATAVKLAVRRLNASGLRPHVTVGVADQAYARRLAAALVFPLDNENAARLARRLLRPHFAPGDREASGELAVAVGESQEK